MQKFAIFMLNCQIWANLNTFELKLLGGGRQRNIFGGKCPQYPLWHCHCLFYKYPWKFSFILTMGALTKSAQSGSLSEVFYIPYPMLQDQKSSRGICPIWFKL